MYTCQYTTSLQAGEFSSASWSFKLYKGGFWWFRSVFLAGWFQFPSLVGNTNNSCDKLRTSLVGNKDDSCEIVTPFAYITRKII